MSNIIIITIFVSGIIGIKSPIVAGIVSALLFPLYFYLFDSVSLYKLILFGPVGFILGYILGKISSWFFSGFKGGKHSGGPTYIGGGERGRHTGGIVYSDDEIKNMKK
jgi:hypothetical protein